MEETLKLILYKLENIESDIKALREGQCTIKNRISRVDDELIGLNIRLDEVCKKSTIKIEKEDKTINIKL